GRCIDGVEIDNRLARRLVNGRLPGRFLKIEGVARAPAGAVGARLAPSVLLDDNRDVEADEGADIAGPLAARADNLDGLPRAGEGGGNLYNAAVARAGIGIYLGKRFDFDIKRNFAQRVFIAIKRPVGAGGRQRHDAALAALHRLDGFGGVADRPFAKLGRMGKARRLADDGAKAEALHRIETRALQPPVIEGEAFRLTIFEIELAIIRVREGAPHLLFHLSPVHSRRREKEIVGGRYISHQMAPVLSSVMLSRMNMCLSRAIVEAPMESDLKDSKSSRRILFKMV